jgi:putative endonuclease
MFWVYILQNPAGRFYIGQTDNHPTRLANHNRTDEIGGKFTRKNGPWMLVWSESHPTRSSAMQRERQIKRMNSARWILKCSMKTISSNAIIFVVQTKIPGIHARKRGNHGN